jgi:hypothetical protein
MPAPPLELRIWGAGVRISSGATETGKGRFERLKAGLAEAEDRALAPLAPTDRRELLRLLRILHDYHAVPLPSAESRG